MEIIASGEEVGHKIGNPIITYKLPSESETAESHTSEYRSKYLCQLHLKLILRNNTYFTYLLFIFIWWLLFIYCDIFIYTIFAWYLIIFWAQCLFLSLDGAAQKNISILSSISEGTITPIAALSPYQNKWEFCVKCIYRYKQNNYVNINHGSLLPFFLSLNVIHLRIMSSLCIIVINFI